MLVTANTVLVHSDDAVIKKRELLQNGKWKISSEQVDHIAKRATTQWRESAFTHSVGHTYSLNCSIEEGHVNLATRNGQDVADNSAYNGSISLPKKTNINCSTRHHYTRKTPQIKRGSPRKRGRIWGNRCDAKGTALNKKLTRLVRWPLHFVCSDVSLSTVGVAELIRWEEKKTPSDQREKKGDLLNCRTIQSE